MPWAYTPLSLYLLFSCEHQGSNHLPAVSQHLQACVPRLQSLRSLWGTTPYIIHEVGPMLGSGLAEQTRALLQGIVDNFAAGGDTNQTVVVLPYDDGSSGYGELQCHQSGA